MGEYFSMNIVEEDHRPVLKRLKEIKGEAETAMYINSKMKEILLHYIGCTWGACCTMKFNDLIKPYLKDVELLDGILRSEVIRDRANVIIGKTGARIFDLLLYQLKMCDSMEIKDYLNKEFARQY